VKLRYNRERERGGRERKRIGGGKDSNSGTLQPGGICVGPALFVLAPLITLLLEGKMDHGASTYHVLRMEERNRKRPATR
jgi:hypothetical protein